ADGGRPALAPSERALETGGMLKRVWRRRTKGTKTRGNPRLEPPPRIRFASLATSGFAESAAARWGRAGLPVLQMGQGVKHQVRQEQKSAEQHWEGQRCRLPVRAVIEVAEAVIHFHRLKQNIPTVESQEPPEVNAEPA